MADPAIQHDFALAWRHLTSGQLPEAEQLYRQILNRQPRNADAIHLLGVIRRKNGDNTAAIDLIRQAISINPACENAHFNLANALRDHGLKDQAIAAYQKSVALGQNVPHSNHNLQLVLAAARKPEDAVQFYNQGNSLAQQARFANAIDAYRHAISIRPDFAEAYCNLGNALVEEKQLDAAIGAYLQAIQANPNLPQAHHNLGKAFSDKGQLDQAIAANQQAIALQPDYASALRNLANNLFEAGRLNESLAICRHALRDCRKFNAEIHSDLIYKLHFDPASDARAITDEARGWNQQHAQSLERFIEAHPNDRSPNRRLRIGYVSPDFRQHVIGINLVPLFRNHDRQKFEIICYSQCGRPDAMTQWFMQHADLWRETHALSDQQLAKQIRTDCIDVLVDLALHTPENRLLTFARKPAPVQITFAGYPGTTGLTAIDYRLSDPYLDSPAADESVCSEKTLRLPNSFWCYDPGDCHDLQVSPLPARESANLTFGCLNNFAKVNPSTLDLWARVMQQIGNSRLLLLAKQGSHRQATLDYMKQRGIGTERIEFAPLTTRRKYLEQYHCIDIGFDTFPYNGHTTSLDSFWMGVPVVTLVGQTPVSRAGWCQLSNLELADLAAQTPDQFVRIATSLARDLPRLEQIRVNLRTQMLRSPLMNAMQFARDIETAYRTIWRSWCDAESG